MRHKVVELANKELRNRVPSERQAGEDHHLAPYGLITCRDNMPEDMSENVFVAVKPW